jgi:hypothetical protein
MCTLQERVEMGLDTNMFDSRGQKRRSWVRRNRSFFISIGVHAAVLWIAGLIVFSMVARPEPAVVVSQREIVEERFYDDSDNSQVRTPQVEGRIVEKPIVPIEEEVEADVEYAGASVDNLSNKNLEADGCVDVYSFAAGRAGAYGVRIVEYVYESDSCG